MNILSDLHIHSRYSRACSKQISIDNLEKYARIKGLNLLGTGDFTHPEWIKELKSKLTEDESGILRTKTGFPFLMQTEISLIYTTAGKGRRIHYVVLTPGLETADQFTDELGKRGRLDYDGRPIFGFDSKELIDITQGISKETMVIPAHVWTPYFGLFGSKTGFDTVEECFGEKSKHIHAIETGISSDPAMNWRISGLDKYNLVSFSDMHSFWPWRIGREATVFDCKLTYGSIFNALKTGNGLAGTIEVKPDYGRYHLDGHAACKVCMTPDESKKHGNLCPKCGKPITIGVLNRVEELADRPEGAKPDNAKDFQTLIPLSEIIKGVFGVSMLASKKVWTEYYNLINAFGNEFSVLRDTPKEKIEEITSKAMADAIIKNREDKINVRAGYDGEYGVPVFNEEEMAEAKTAPAKRLQRNLGDF